MSNGIYKSILDLSTVYPFKKKIEDTTIKMEYDPYKWKTSGFAKNEYMSYNSLDVRFMDYIDKMNPTISEQMHDMFTDELITEGNIRVEYHELDQSYRVYVGSKLKIKRKRGQNIRLLLNYVKPKISTQSFLILSEKLVRAI